MYEAPSSKIGAVPSQVVALGQGSFISRDKCFSVTLTEVLTIRNDRRPTRDHAFRSSGLAMLGDGALAVRIASGSAGVLERLQFSRASAAMSREQANSMVFKGC